MKKAKIMNAFNSLIEQFKAQIVTSFDEDEAQQAEVTTYALKDDPNVTVAVDAEGNVTFSDGREIVDGEYALDADLVLVIENGKGEIKQVKVKDDEKPEEAPLDASKQFSAINSMLCEQIAKVKDMFADLTAYTIYPTWDGVFVGIDAVGNLWWSDGRTMTNYLLPISYDKAIQIDEFGKGKLIDIVDPYCLRSDVENAKSANEELTAKVVAFENEVANFATVKADFEAQIAELQKENEALKSQIPSKVGEFNVNDKPQEQEVKVDLWQQAYGSK